MTDHQQLAKALPSIGGRQSIPTEEEITPRPPPIRPPEWRSRCRIRRSLHRGSGRTGAPDAHAARLRLARMSISPVPPANNISLFAHPLGWWQCRNLRARRGTRLARDPRAIARRPGLLLSPSQVLPPLWIGRKPSPLPRRRRGATGPLLGRADYAGDAGAGAGARAGAPHAPAQRRRDH